MQHLNITVYGRVQGVGFRRAAKLQAQYMGIKGFVKNMPDGSVYIEAEGERPALEEFVSWCSKGPSYARVEDIKTDESTISNYTAFESCY